MPFAVTLMAKLAVESLLSAKDLLDAWSESGTKILSNNPEQSMDQSIRLSVESDLVQRNPDAIILLAILSLLPAGTTNENLRWWAPEIKSMIPSAIATLLQAALLVENRRENFASPIFSWFLSSNRLCISETGSHKRFGSRYICCAVNMF